MRLLIILSVFIGSQSFAEDMTLDEALSTSHHVPRGEETAFDASYLRPKKSWVEPVFEKVEQGRFINSEITLSDRTIDVEPLGQLQVQAEIPFSYPALTRYSVQRKVLAELDEEDQAAKAKATAKTN